MVNDNLPTPGSLVTQFVDRILNGMDPGGVDEIFSSGYRDHDPILIPGFIAPTSAGLGSIHDIQQITRFLSLPIVDLFFTLEDLIIEGHRAAYRLYGEGTIVTERVPGSTPMPVANGVDVRASRNKLVGRQMHISYFCTGIFNIQNGRLTERWGIQWLR